MQHSPDQCSGYLTSHHSESTSHGQIEKQISWTHCEQTAVSRAENLAFMEIQSD